MTPRPIYRWKSFWLGVILLLCLGWAWNRAMKDNHWAYVVTPEISFVVGHDEGRMGIFANVIGRRWEVGARSSLHRTPVVWFPDAWHVQALRANANGVTRPAHAHLLVAHWFVMLVFLLVWLAALAWKWRREQRRIASSS